MKLYNKYVVRHSFPDGILNSKKKKKKLFISKNKVSPCFSFLMRIAGFR